MALHQHDDVVDERLAKRDNQMTALVTDLATVKADVLLLKWMMGFLLSINLAILLKLLLR